MEAELRRSERLAATGQLAANMAHEIRNPLAAISGSLEMLRDREGRAGDADERQRLMEHRAARGRAPRPPDRGLPRVRAAGRRRARAARRWRRWSRRCVKMFEASRAAGRAPWRATCPADCAVLADPRQLRQVLWNLLLNAVQALPEGGRIRIAARRVAEPPQERGPQRRNALDEGVQYRGDRHLRHRGGHRTRGAGARLRAVLHHEAGRLGPRPADRAPHRREPRRQPLAREPPGRRAPRSASGSPRRRCGA